MDSSTWQQLLKLYYEDDLRQQEVGRILNMGPAQVSKRLKEAREKGYVRFLIRPPVDDDLHREIPELEAKLGIQILPSGGDGLAPVAAEAAGYFQQHASDGQTVVVDGGTTVREFVRSVPVRAFRDMTVVPLCADPPSDESSAFQVMTLLCERLQPDVKKRSLPYHSSPLLRELIDGVRKVAAEADFVFLGVAPFFDDDWNTSYDFLVHLGETPGELHKKYRDVIAFCGNYALAADGTFVDIEEFHGRLPWSLRFGDLQQLAAGPDCRAVLMATGSSKLEAVNAVIYARLCNTLIVDRSLAAALIDHHLHRPRRPPRPDA